MKFENTEVYGFKRALKGMRNPLESWRKNDTVEENGKVVIGENDLDLAQRLIKSGSEHRKFMRQIFVSVDITGPLYWWKEFDTYKVGTTANSTSTMHKLASTPITAECFEIDDYNSELDYDGTKLGDVIDKHIEFLETADIHMDDMTAYYGSPSPLICRFVEQHKPAMVSECGCDVTQ